jgi:hypothetical protein
MQPPKTINNWRPQVDPKVMDFGDPVVHGWDFGARTQSIYLLLVLAPLNPTPALPRSRPPTNLALEGENLADNLILLINHPGAGTNKSLFANL